MAVDDLQRCAARHIIRANRYWNALAVLGRVPDELLQSIFRLALDCTAESYYRDLNRLQLVCQQWNCVAKSSPSLWSVVNIRHGNDMVQMALRKSKASPLDLQYIPLLSALWPCHSWQSSLRRYHDLVTQTSERWHSLSLRYEDGMELGWLCRRAAPLLERLTRTGADSQSSTNLFQGTTPRLHTTHLDAISLHWSANYSILRGLRSLRVADLGTTRAPTIPQLFAILERNPSLTTLVLQTVSFPRHDVAAPQVSLKHMRHLHMVGLPSSAVRSILSTLQAPSCVELVATPITRPALDVLPGFVGASQLLRTPMELILSQSAEAGGVLIVDGTGSLEISGTMDAGDLLQHVTTGRLPTGITRLAIGDDVQVGDSVLSTVSALSSTTERVQIGKCNDVMGILRQLIFRRPTSDGTAWLMPRLRRLEMDGTGLKPAAFLSMIRGRYGDKASRYAEAPRRVELLEVQVERPTGIEPAIEKIVGRQRVKWSYPDAHRSRFAFMPPGAGLVSFWDAETDLELNWDWCP